MTCMIYAAQRIEKQNMKRAYDYIYTFSIINIVFPITFKHLTYSKG